jgi:hypothetical protein
MDSAGRMAPGWEAVLQLERSTVSKIAKKRDGFVLIFMLLVENGRGKSSFV